MDHFRRSDDTGECGLANKGQNRLEYQLKKMYQGRKNIVKAIDGWEFDAKGYISSAVFR